MKQATVIVSRKLRKEQAETLETMRKMGIRWNIQTQVDHRVELHFAYRRLDGRERVHFVAEVDGYGNVAEWGPYGGGEFRDPNPNTIVNADGERIAV